jgi:hypothetical protein
MTADRDGHLFVSTTHEFAPVAHPAAIDQTTGAVTTVVVRDRRARCGEAGGPVASPDRLAWDRRGA